MTLLGLWSGGLNLTEFSETLQSLNLTDGEEKRLFRTNQNESLATLQAFNNALQEQKAGSVMEMINGTRMLIFYEPVQFHSTIWAVLLLKPL
jgi:hypothetical protein